MIIYQLTYTEKRYMPFTSIGNDKYYSYFLERVLKERNFDWVEKKPRFKFIKIINFSYNEYKRFYKIPDFRQYYVPMFSEKALIALKDLLEKSGDFFEIENFDKVYKYRWKGLKRIKNRYFVFNVKDRIDCLDIEKSNIERDMHLLNRGEVFIEEKIDKNLDIFKIKRFENNTYVTQKFVDRVLEHNLKAFTFIPVYSSIGEKLPEIIET
ncbi:MAG: DUF1629 domain-containing protein [Cyanobacteriota bacterium]